MCKFSIGFVCLFWIFTKYCATKVLQLSWLNTSETFSPYAYHQISCKSLPILPPPSPLATTFCLTGVIYSGHFMQTESHNVGYRYSFNGQPYLELTPHMWQCQRFTLLTQWSNQGIRVCDVSHHRQVDIRAFLERRKGKHALIQHHTHRMAPEVHPCAGSTPCPACRSTRPGRHPQPRTAQSQCVWVGAGEGWPWKWIHPKWMFI